MQNCNYDRRKIVREKIKDEKKNENVTPKLEKNGKETKVKEDNEITKA